jgi:hypothetical protein
MKVCRICGEEKNLSDFHKNGRFLRTECKKCNNKRKEISRKNKQIKKPIPSNPNHKICITCGHEKPFMEFGVHSKRKDGSLRYRNDCKECRKEKVANNSKNWYEANKQIVLDRKYERERPDRERKEKERVRKEKERVRKQKYENLFYEESRKKKEKEYLIRHRMWKEEYRRFLKWCCKNNEIPNLKKVPYSCLRYKEVCVGVDFFTGETSPKSYKIYYVEIVNGDFREHIVRMADNISNETLKEIKNNLPSFRYSHIEDGILINRHWGGIPTTHHWGRLYKKWNELSQKRLKEFYRKRDKEKRCKYFYDKKESHFDNNDTDVQFFQALAMSSV